LICPKISTFVSNCYTSPARLFVIGGFEISSKEGTTQGLLITDDFSAGGTILNLKSWWLDLNRLGPLFGCFPEETKCWII